MAEAFELRPRFSLPTARLSSLAYHWLLDPTGPGDVVVPYAGSRALRVARLQRTCEDRWEVVLEGLLPTGRISIRLSGVVAPLVRLGQYVVKQQPLGRAVGARSCSPGVGFDVAITDVKDLAFSVAVDRGMSLYARSTLAAVRTGLETRAALPIKST